MAKYPGLNRRENGVWYVVKRVPVDLRHVHPREHERRSLRTSERRTAIQRYPLKLAEITLGFEKLRVELREKGTIAAALSRGRLEDLSRNEIEQLVAKWWGLRGPFPPPEIDEHLEPAEVAAACDEDAVRAEEAAPSVADRLLVDAGMAASPWRVENGPIRTRVPYPDVDRGSTSYRQLVDLVARALRMEAQVAKDDLLGTADAPYDPLFNPEGRRDGKSVQSARTVRDLTLAYRHERETLRGKESTERKYGLLFRVVEDVVGHDLPVAQITRAKCIDVLEFLKKLPPNAAKRFPRLTLHEAVAHAEAKGLPGLAPGSVASYMQGLNAILGWAEREGWGVRVHTKGLVPARKAKVRRRGFRSDELEKLFGALGEFRADDPTMFWVPALALYTGARAGEICQLSAEDVVEVDGVWCLDLSEFDADGRRVETKRLKTTDSERFVPLHPHLLEVGLLPFVRKKAGGRLFPDLTPGPKGSYSHNFSKRFGRFKKRVGFAEPALVFHSFRHGFRDACRDAGISDETGAALGGWAAGNQAAKYGNRGAVPRLYRAVEKIDFGEFRLACPGDASALKSTVTTPSTSGDFATGFNGTK